VRRFERRLTLIAFSLAGMLSAAAQTTLPASSAPTRPATETSASVKPLAARLDAIFNAPEWASAHWGVLVKDLETSEVLYEHEPGKSVMPASNMKLFTTAASLVTLGADYQFKTNIYASGPIDSAGTLHGNIYIVGSGDPSISGRYLDTPTTAILAQWADAITSAGIRKIDGDIIGDDDIFDDKAFSGSWQYDYLQEWYAAENSGLAINDNCWDALFSPTIETLRGQYLGRPGSNLPATKLALRTVDPLNTKYFQLNTEIAFTTSTSADNHNFVIQRLPNSNAITVSGTLAANVDGISERDGLSSDDGWKYEVTRGKPVHEWGSIHNGTLFTVTLLQEQLERSGVKVTGKPVDMDDMDPRTAEWQKANPGRVIHTHVSPPLSKILAIVNKPSQNFYADMLLKVVGAKVYGVGSWDNGEKVVKDLITTAGADSKSFNMADGSGLSRRDLVEPRQVVALLAYMAGRSDFSAYHDSLPIMGVDGTLKGRMAGTPAEGKVHAKTGTIGGVRSLSGYLTGANGHRLVFCMIANNFYVPTSAATDAQNRAVLELLNSGR